MHSPSHARRTVLWKNINHRLLSIVIFLCCCYTIVWLILLPSAYAQPVHSQHSSHEELAKAYDVRAAEGATRGASSASSGSSSSSSSSSPSSSSTGAFFEGEVGVVRPFFDINAEISRAKEQLEQQIEDQQQIKDSKEEEQQQQSSPPIILQPEPAPLTLHPSLQAPEVTATEIIRSVRVVPIENESEAVIIEEERIVQQQARDPSPLQHHKHEVVAPAKHERHTPHIQQPPHLLVMHNQSHHEAIQRIQQEMEALKQHIIQRVLQPFEEQAYETLAEMMHLLEWKRRVARSAQAQLEEVQEIQQELNQTQMEQPNKQAVEQLLEVVTRSAKLSRVPQVMTSSDVINEPPPMQIESPPSSHLNSFLHQTHQIITNASESIYGALLDVWLWIQVQFEKMYASIPHNLQHVFAAASSEATPSLRITSRDEASSSVDRKESLDSSRHWNNERQQQYQQPQQRTQREESEIEDFNYQHHIHPPLHETSEEHEDEQLEFKLTNPLTWYGAMKDGWQRLTKEEREVQEAADDRKHAQQQRPSEEDLAFYRRFIWDQ